MEFINSKSRYTSYKRARETVERERESERERGREVAAMGATCNGVACHPSLVVCASSVAQQTLN